MSTARREEEAMPMHIVYDEQRSDRLINDYSTVV